MSNVKVAVSALLPAFTLNILHLIFYIPYETLAKR